MAGCSSTGASADISPPVSPVASGTSTLIAPSAEPSPTPLPTPILPPPPGPDWPVENVEDLKKVFESAQVILIKVEDFLLCPPFYDPQGKMESKICTNLIFEVGEKERQKFIAAIEEGKTQCGQLPEELYGMGLIPSWEYPQFSVLLLLHDFKLSLYWLTERSFVVTQTYYPDLLKKDVWFLEFDHPTFAEVQFAQEKPVLYKAMREAIPPFVLPPEYFGHVLEYERVVVEYDGKICEYRRGHYPSFVGFMHGMLARSIPVDGGYPSQEPRAVFTFWVRGKEYTVKMWEDGRFSYREKVYQYIPRETGEPEPSFQVVLEGFLRDLDFTECTPP